MGDLSIALLPERIAGQLTIVPGHWMWTGRTNNDGYGLVWAKYPATPDKPGDKRAVHLVVWELLIGLVPDGLELDHTCPFRLCAYPGCMEPVTHAENQRRAGERQTHCRKAGHPRTPENLYRDPTTGRTRCIPCMREAEIQRPPRRRSR